ncbi:putative LRR receptor-like serine/threonine-protein kinase-like [Capsicum annuum]|nr:putative LRR receptor-like serine/threonine-protein kinase-like [Capsicum annuum]
MLRYLQVGSNPLNGVLPNSIGNLSSTIEILYIGDAHLNGLIPPGIGNMSGLIILVFEHNNLTGNIPPEIEGEIPPNIGELKAIVDLDLSGNHLSGKGFQLECGITHVGFKLGKVGCLGDRGPSYAIESVSGLQKGPRILKISGLIWSVFRALLVCLVSPINNTGKQSKSKELVLKIVISVVTLSFLIFFLVSISIMKWLKKRKSKDVEKVPEIGTYQLISYHDIQRATNNFDWSNLIGEGSSGFVYKGTLSSGTVVAIKVLDLENEQVFKRFDTECEVMRNDRHINLVPVITTCSSEYLSAFVLQYISNGSLENWLYGEDFHFNLLQRVTVMLDAVMAIEYLHHGYDTPIVHCDLKPARVLLDEDLVARVGDFGMSKILAISKSMAHTETLGTLSYIAPGTMMDVIDGNLFPEEEQITSKSEICIASMVKLSLDCTMDMPESRITMKDVVKRLNQIKNSFLET